MREFIVDLTTTDTREKFVAAFNAGFCDQVGGHWSGRSWDAFHDYLSWPEEERYQLILRGWHGCVSLTPEEKKMILDIMAENPHVEAIFT